MRNPHQVSCLQQVHVSRVLGLERERENEEKGVCTNGSGSKGVAFNSLVLRVDRREQEIY